VVRRVLAALRNARIDKKADLDEQDEIKVVRSIAKQHKESIDQFRAFEQHGRAAPLAAPFCLAQPVTSRFMPVAI